MPRVNEYGVSAAMLAEAAKGEPKAAADSSAASPPSSIEDKTDDTPPADAGQKAAKPKSKKAKKVD